VEEKLSIILTVTGASIGVNKGEAGLDDASGLTGVVMGLISCTGLEGAIDSILAADVTSEAKSFDSTCREGSMTGTGSLTSLTTGDAGIAGSVRGVEGASGSLLATETSERESNVGVNIPSSERGVLGASGTSLLLVVSSWRDGTTFACSTGVGMSSLKTSV